jgi:hypothetical protein
MTLEMMKTKILILLVAIVCVGCATSSKNLNMISIGMSKSEVIDILGEPESTSAKGGAEYMIYSLKERISKPGETIFPVAIEGKYYVRLVGGKVESYGRVGDFDSTKPFETKQTIDLKIEK